MGKIVGISPVQNRLKVPLTVDEAASAILRSALPTVITEGKDDYVAYRKLESRLSDLSVSFLPVGGKIAALQVWKKVISVRSDIPVVIDNDMWVYNGIPVEYCDQRVICTDGYSIENDLYRDGNFENLLSSDELPSFKSEIEKVCLWFEGQLELVSQGIDAPIAHHPNAILSLDQSDYHPVDNSKQRGVALDYRRLLRGKTLASTLMRQLSRPGRVPKHAYLSLLEIAACANGYYMSCIEDAIRKCIEKKSYSPS